MGLAHVELDEALAGRGDEPLVEAVLDGQRVRLLAVIDAHQPHLVRSLRELEPQVLAHPDRVDLDPVDEDGHRRVARPDHVDPPGARGPVVDGRHPHERQERAQPDREEHETIVARAEHGASLTNGAAAGVPGKAGQPVAEASEASVVIFEAER